MHRQDLRSLSAGLTTFVVVSLAFAPGAWAQSELPNAIKGPIKALRSGPLLVHGNFCGIGARPGAAPIDELDAACMRHDACTKTGKLPSCSCDDRLRIEAEAVTKDPGAPVEEKAAAAATATAMALLICKITPPVPSGVSPPTPVAPPPAPADDALPPTPR